MTTRLARVRFGLIAALIATACAACGGGGTPASVTEEKPAGACRAQCTVLASGVIAPSPFSLIVDDTNIYWTSGPGPGDGGPPASAVMSMPLRGGTPRLVSRAYAPKGIAVDATNIYWVDGPLAVPENKAGTVSAVPIGGGAAMTLADANFPGPIVVSGSNVYWGDADSAWAVPIAGGTPRQFGSDGSHAGGLAVDQSSVFWTDQWAETVMRAPVEGGTPETIASGQNGPTAMAIDARNIYWLDECGGTVMKLPIDGGKDGGLEPTVLASGQIGPEAIAVDDTSVYWTTWGSYPEGLSCSQGKRPVDGGAVDWMHGTVMKMPLDGGPPVQLAWGRAGPLAIAVDGASVYWAEGAEGGGGYLMKTPK